MKESKNNILRFVETEQDINKVKAEIQKIEIDELLAMRFQKNKLMKLTIRVESNRFEQPFQWT